MRALQNLHVHCKYCDGADTPEEILETAIGKSFSSIGFSSHSKNPNGSSRYKLLGAQEIPEYQAHISRLKQQYSDRIQVFCGMEVDMYSQVPMDGFDYLIGSVHFLKKDDRYLSFDRSQENVAELIETEFSGDGMAYARLYYETLAQLPQYGKFDIIGHFDLITKHAENVSFFDTQSRQYRSWAVEAAEALAGKIPLFEVNTGAIARGYRTTPYPDPFLLKEMKRLGFGAVITSDCHDRRKLDCGYDAAKALLLSSGFREIYLLTDHGFQPISL